MHLVPGIFRAAYCRGMFVMLYVGSSGTVPELPYMSEFVAGADKVTVAVSVVYLAYVGEELGT